MSAAAAAIDLLKALEGPEPCGPSLRYDPLYDRIRQERRQDSGGAVLDGTAKVADHKAAINLITEALATRTKDLQLAVWLTDSLIHREGFAGLRRGIDLVRGLLEEFWDNLHPQPEAPGDYEYRISALEWLSSEPRVSRETCPILSVRFVPITINGLNWLDYEEKGRKDAPASKKEEFEKGFQATPKLFYRERDADLASCIESVQALERLCDERFGKNGPAFGGLTRALDDLRLTVRSLLRLKLETDPDPLEPDVKKDGEPSSPGVASGAEGTAPVTAPGAAPADELGVDVRGLEPQQPREAVARIVAAARYLRRVEPANPAGYLVIRALRWGELRAGGSDVQPALLAAPATEVRRQLKILAAAERWAELLELAESAVAGECGRGWLDAQRYAVLACDKLGYTAAARAIRSELACLLQDYPKLGSATLPDDTGAANPETIEWLAIVRKN
jgi:type VI secretion system protein ImpA